MKNSQFPAKQSENNFHLRTEQVTAVVYLPIMKSVQQEGQVSLVQLLDKCYDFWFAYFLKYFPAVEYNIFQVHVRNVSSFKRHFKPEVPNDERRTKSL
jgi:hypothetical protein